MIRKDNIRIAITLSKKQDVWLQKTAKKLKLSKSQTIKWLVSKNLANLLNQIPEKELTDLIKIAKTPWIIEDEDYGDK